MWTTPNLMGWRQLFLQLYQLDYKLVYFRSVFYLTVMIVSLHQIPSQIVNPVIEIFFFKLSDAGELVTITII